jgi:23S rRNA pseudouridine955/2504/2580 synthase
MKGLSKDSATWHEVEGEAAGQRIDNYLTKHLKGVPKSHIYRILRSGEVRVNSGRVRAEYRLAEGDRLRLPPLRTAARSGAGRPAAPPLHPHILHEDEQLIVIDKPAGLAVHGGSGISHGVVEQLRAARPQAPFLELAHRLDRDTSGVLMLAKRRSALLALHRQLREGQVRKLYLVLVKGRWRDAKRSVKLPLDKYVLKTGERRVAVSGEGAPAHTVFRLQRAWQDYSLLEAELKTGRTHQIRVHLAHEGHPIVGDDQYGDFELNRRFARGEGARGERFARMFLHARRLAFDHPATGARVTVESPLPDECVRLLAAMFGPTRAETR